MNQSGKIALGGIISALCLVCMFLTGVFPFATYALPAIAGVLLIVVVIELGKRWAWLVYVVVALLSLLIAPDAEAKLIFILFFGYYPIVKASIEKMKKPVMGWLLKFAIFNAAVISSYFLAIGLLQIPADSFEIFGVNLPLVFLALGNVVFFIYDYAVTSLATMYVRRMQPVLHRRLHIR